jgi:hypothetical protein
MMTLSPHKENLPWYRHPWPWFLMIGPLIVVIASLATAWLAIKSDDGLVTADYYQKGLAIHQTLLSSEKARKMGLTASVKLADHSLVIRLQALSPLSSFPDRLLVTISHPTRAGLDQNIELKRIGNYYQGDNVQLPVAGHWLILVEDDQKLWRLLGNVILPANGETVIGANQTTR